MSYTTYHQQQAQPGYAVPQYSSHYQPYENSQQQSPEAYLSKAFPNIDRATVFAILASTRGEIQPAYNALSAISSAGSVPSTLIPPHCPSPTPSQSDVRNSLTSPTQQAASSVHHYPSSSEPPPPPYQHSNSYQIPSPGFPPNPSSAVSAPSPLPTTRDISSHLPDISKLKLNGSNATDQRVPIHNAHCDGCNASPIKGNRWHCLICADYDLCDECKDDGIHNNHRLIMLRPSIESHKEVYCDGCNDPDRILYGTRFMCLKHVNEDWCEHCVSSGKACKGPFKEFKQSETGHRLEIEHSVPMPQEWKRHLMPPLAGATYNVMRIGLSDTWLSFASGHEWSNTPWRNRQETSNGPSYKLEYKYTKGHFKSDHKFSWTITDSKGKKLYDYLLEKDRKSLAVKNEKFGEHNGRSFTPVWKHGTKNDSLSFEDPKSGVHYRWISNRPISICGDERFDFQRMALFTQQKGKEVIVADWAWWDGHPELPEDCMTIRDPNIDHALVLATICIVFNHQWQIMNDEAERDVDAFKEADMRARLTNLGEKAYWGAADFPSDGQQGSQKMTTAEKWRYANQLLGAFNQGLSSASNSYNQGVDLGNAINACANNC